MELQNLNNPTELIATVEDNGIGLTPDRFDAFCTTDTSFKLRIGGKGIGRLLWLDAFSKIDVISHYISDKIVNERSFSFVLHDSDQIQNEILEPFDDESSRTGTFVRFTGLRGNAYNSFFPARKNTIIKHFGSHFLADFLLGTSPRVLLIIDGDEKEFPGEITSLLIEEREKSEIKTKEFGILKLSHYIMHKSASSEFDGLHQIHLVAGNRTVMSQKIDGLLGISRFGPSDDAVYHGCLSGDFLEDRVNQERTNFNFDQSTVEEIARVSAEEIGRNALKDEINQYDNQRVESISAFLSEYPSFGFEAPTQLLTRVPRNAKDPEAYAKALIPWKIRRDYERKTRVQSVIDSLETQDEAVPESIAEAIRKAADEIRAEEQRQLTEYVLRRKISIDVLDALVRKLRKTESGELDHHLEETIHKFICPLRVSTTESPKIERTDHDLWIVDERLSLARYFASDVPFTKIISDSESQERPDLFVWNHVHGLGLNDEGPLRKVLLVEFKKPGRKEYTERYLPQNQINRYLAELKSGSVYTYDGDRVRVAEDCVFYCYIVADIVGELDISTRSWQTTSSGRGRFQPLHGDYRGSIEIIEWRELIDDAKMRNRAFIEQAGTSFARSI